MSGGSVETVCELVEAWNRRDIETILLLCTPQARYVNPPMAVEPGTRQGHSELAEVFRKQWEGLGPGARQEIKRVYPREGEVITTGDVSRAMPGSETRVSNKLVLRWEFEGDLVACVEVLGAGSSFAAALKSAGLDA